ncbi:MAG: signal recognition particle-docking protein FtsY, partial [Chlamydiota bacterium]
MFNFLKKNIAALKGALQKTASGFYHKLESIFKGPLNEESLEKFEEVLIEANFGTKLTSELVEIIRKAAKEHKTTDKETLFTLLKNHLLKELSLYTPLALRAKPSVFLILGVNGSGKTTTTAKLASFYKNQGLQVMVAAADTFRAAALEQLIHWCSLIDVPLITGPSRGDPASVAFDASSKAVHQNADILLIDTAGRLESKTDLMQEMEKIARVIAKKIPGSPHESLLVIDATLGQNALEQAKAFHKHCPLTGLVITKIDSSSRAGVVFS